MERSRSLYYVEVDSYMVSFQAKLTALYIVSLQSVTIRT